MGKEDYFTRENIYKKARKFIQEIESICRLPRFDFELNVAALLIIDMQRYFLDKRSRSFLPSSPAIIPNIRKLISFFQHKERPIIYTQHINTPENAGMLREWWGEIITTKNDLYKLSKRLYLPGAPVIVKTQYDAFYRTNLRKILKENKIKQVVITGVMTNLCCETTARSAFVQGFKVFFVVDGTCTQNEMMHRATLINLAYGFATPVWKIGDSLLIYRIFISFFGTRFFISCL
jgi:isochorismate hydrolase